MEDCFKEADAKGVEYVWAEVKQVGRSAAEVRGRWPQGGLSRVLLGAWQAAWRVGVLTRFHGGCSPAVCTT